MVDGRKMPVIDWQLILAAESIPKIVSAWNRLFS